MTSKQYEELCRYFVARDFQIDIDRVHSIDYLSPQRQCLVEYSHQIDLYWEIETSSSRYIHIANAKWRTPPQLVGQADVLLLQQVKSKLAAHKAWMISNLGFSEQAQAVAADEGIGLHILRPEFPYGGLHRSDSHKIQEALTFWSRRRRAQPMYTHEVVHKEMPLVAEGGRGAQTQETPPEHAVAATRARLLVPQPDPAPLAPPGPASEGSGAISYFTRQGPGPGYRAKG